MPPQPPQAVSTRRGPTAADSARPCPRSRRACRTRATVWWHRFAPLVASSFVTASMPVTAGPLSRRSPQQPPPPPPSSSSSSSSITVVMPSSASAASPPPTDPANTMSPVMLLAMVAAGLLILSALFRLIRRLSDEGDACAAAAETGDGQHGLPAYSPPDGPEGLVRVLPGGEDGGDLPPAYDDVVARAPARGAGSGPETRCGAAP
ncbi:hypothetical protein GGF31_005450 [Allomyces arbusculus]|nr:hypothetical protein GGF31_005450 [Allomyces arbusculus]